MKASNVATLALLLLANCGGTASHADTAEEDAGADALPSHEPTDGGMASGPSEDVRYGARYGTMDWWDDAGNGTINDLDRKWRWRDARCEYYFDPSLEIVMTLSHGNDGSFSVTSATIQGTVSIGLNINGDRNACPLDVEVFDVAPTNMAIRSSANGVVAEGDIEWTYPKAPTYSAFGEVTVSSDALRALTPPQAFRGSVKWTSAHFVAPNMTPEMDLEFDLRR